MLRALSLILVATVMTPIAAHAAKAGKFKEISVIKVRQIDYGQQSLSAEIPPSVKVRAGDKLIATVNGVTCDLKVTKIVHLRGTYRNLALASLKGCQIANRIVRGQALEKSDFSVLKQAQKKTVAPAPQTVAASPAVKVEAPVTTTPVVNTLTEPAPVVETPVTPATIRGFQFSVFYPHTENLREVGVTTANGVVDGDIVTSATGGLSLRWNYTRTRDLGFTLGASYDFPRKFEQSLIATANGSFDVGNTFTRNEALALVSTEANATFGLNDKFYGYGGVNYSVPILENTTTMQASGDLGLQVGAGYMVNSSLAIEGGYRLNQVRIDYNGKTNHSIGKFHMLMISASYVLGL